MKRRSRKIRLAIMGSHVIPYRTPLYKVLAKQGTLDFTVFYGDTYGAVPRQSWWGVKDFVWQGDHLSGYRSRMLPNWAPRPDPSSFAGKLNPTLGAELGLFHPDAVLVMGYGGVYQLASIATAKALRAKLLFTCDTSVLGDPTGLRLALKHLIVERVYSLVDRFLVTSSYNRQHYLNFRVPPSRLVRYPWAVDNESFERQRVALAPRRDEARAAFGIGAEQPCVVAVSGLRPEKNLDELLRAAARVEDLFVLVVGSGPERERLRQTALAMLPGRHHFVGFLNQDELGKAYSAADLFAMPSRFEPWGLTCNEAMCFGLPIVVSSQVGAGPDLVVPGRTGAIYPIGDLAAFSAALREVVGWVAERREDVKSSVLTHIASFSAQEQAAVLHQTLQELCG